MNGAESLVHTLLGCGVEVCFANPGTSEMQLVAAVDRQHGMRAVLGLFEGVVTGAAEFDDTALLSRLNVAEDVPATTADDLSEADKEPVDAQNVASWAALGTATEPFPAETADFDDAEDLTLEALRGRVVVLEAFQMLCPGCVAYGLPQAERVHTLFPPEQVTVIGLHSVFEHHAAMTPVSLQAFLHEYRIHFPVAVDAPGEHGHAMPRTMRAYDMQGTPTLTLIDADGIIRHQHFGRIGDLVLGTQIALLLGEAGTASRQPDSTSASGCPVDPSLGGCVTGSSDTP